ncbi:hypothetical protein J421_5228 (plasmid) [Gemmatirosa kalamazoonensis]|uniref:Uncharacterized protein n=1 Tax=Gemmatirosa kalamazoonensis TaxID=861299 RepID=W0RT69_9BACT|nr:hypothetical protein [Gemmatirosa kalamazoonensis]AHG92763.1 hypothetical protein J421_5228 [Gemmatirosa kalamazoonensis]
MNDSALPPAADATLPELLAARARRASDLRLALDVGVGVLVAAAALFWRPTAWVLLLSAALCFVAFGLWGIADRAGNRTLRAAAATLGVVAALALGAGVVAIGLGTIIS